MMKVELCSSELALAVPAGVALETTNEGLQFFALFPATLVLTRSTGAGLQESFLQRL
jgi:hypothetical protein